MLARRVWSAVAVVAGVAVGSGVARAESATCEVPIVHALPGGGTTQIDPKIDKLKPYLSRAPFAMPGDANSMEKTFSL